MNLIDVAVLVASLAFVTLYGLWKSRGNRDLDGYLLADRRMKWGTIAFAIMATQASAITFLSTPGQAYADGMRFVQFYFGLPLAMIVLCVTVVPIFHRLKVFTAYQYLEQRFDGKTRTLAATLFLIQRGLAAGLTIFAPSIILSVVLGWSLFWTNLLMGGIVVLYTATGGTKAVNHTQVQQLSIMLLGLALAFALAVAALPEGIGVLDALHVAGAAGRLDTIDLSPDPKNRYTLWSGLIGGFFLALSYFGTDQSQVGRYLTGQTVTQSRFGLVVNGLAKLPMQFFILLTGVFVFACHQFSPMPVFFNPAEVRKLEQSPHAAEFRALETEHRLVSGRREHAARAFVDARRGGAAEVVSAARARFDSTRAEVAAVRGDVVALMKRNDPKAQTSDTNYVFLRFILAQFPVGVIGLMLAAVFAAAMSSTAAELNALASTTVVDVWRRLPGNGPREAAAVTLDPDTEPDLDRSVGRAEPVNPEADRREVRVSVLATIFWGAFAVAFAEFATHLGSLIEAVNILGSLFYGTILGIFLTGFYVRRAGGNAVFVAALIAEVAVLACFKLTSISFLWYNVIGCVLVVALALALSAVWPRRGADPIVPAAAAS